MSRQKKNFYNLFFFFFFFTLRKLLPNSAKNFRRNFSKTGISIESSRTEAELNKTKMSQSFF